MKNIGRFLYNNFVAPATRASASMDNKNSPHTTPSSSQASGTLGNSSSNPNPPGHYKPSVEDVFEVKELFVKIKKLPVELADIFMDFAEYWPHTTVTLKSQVRAIGGRPSENNLILRSFPLGYIPRPTDFDDNTPPNRRYPSDRKLNPLFADVPGQEEHERVVPNRGGSQDDYAPDKRKWPLEDVQTTEPSESTTKLLESWARKSAVKSEHPCRKIVFTIKAHDQGFGRERRYNESNTWLDTGLERIEVDPMLRDQGFSMAYGAPDSSEDVKEGEDVPCILRTYNPAGNHVRLVDGMQERFYDQPFRPHPRTLQINKYTTNAAPQIVIEWRYDDSCTEQELKDVGRGEMTGDGSFVKSLKVGDVITIWARARYAGWVNSVEELQMEVYWAV